MGTLLSPGVQVIEKDFSGIVPNVATGIGGIVGRFTQGPINTPILVSSEEDLVNIFGKPTETNYLEWFTASQFLQYTNKLWCIRAKPTGALNAYVNTGVVNGTISFGSQSEYDNGISSVDPDVMFLSRELGAYGNNLGIIIVDSSNWSAFKSWNDAGGYSFAAALSYKPETTEYVARYAGTAKNDEVHIIVFDATGFITGTKNQILEVFQGLSKAGDALDYKGQPIYYANYLNLNSKYVWLGSSALSTTANGTTLFAPGTGTAGVIGAKSFGLFNFSFTNSLPSTTSGVSTYTSEAFGAAFILGTNGTYADESEIVNSYSLFANKELIDVSLFPTAGYKTLTTLKYIIENVAFVRQDSIVFYSPTKYETSAVAWSGVVITDSSPTAEADFIAAKNALNIAETYASYGVCDTGYKYIFDKYNNKYRWVPLNGDVAGLCAQVERLADAWYSPAGFNRGGIKNVIKLAFNPTQAQRDILYPQSINPVVAFPGQGVVLYGDKTLTLKPSAFDRINVRRLFIILEKAISIAARYQLFEFNDTFTRAQFKNMVEPFLRSIQGRRGITDFLVVCDASNNTGDVVDRNEFVASILIKPARSINYITLSFVATRTDVDFSTLVSV